MLCVFKLSMNKYLLIVLLMFLGGAIDDLHALNSKPDFNGFIQPHISFRTDTTKCNDTVTECELMSAITNSRIQLEGSLSDSLFYTSHLDLSYDSLLDEVEAEFRELYLEHTYGDLKTRLGRQVITLGVGDLLFINDVFAKDWQAFFLGLPTQYLKRGTDAVRLEYYQGDNIFELIVAHFGKDKQPDPRQFIFPPMNATNIALNIKDEPARIESAIKASSYLGRWEVGAYASHSHYRRTATDFESSTVLYPRLNTFGLSATGPLANGVISIEAGYYDSVEDKYGNKPEFENSQLKILLGYSKQIWNDGTLGVQFFSEKMMNYQNYMKNVFNSYPIRDKTRQVATVRFTQFFRYQTITLNLFAFIGLTEKDQYWIPSIRYGFNDKLWIEAGANIFDGRKQGQFGMLHGNSNFFTTVRYSF